MHVIIWLYATALSVGAGIAFGELLYRLRAHAMWRRMGGLPDSCPCHRCRGVPQRFSTPELVVFLITALAVVYVLFAQVLAL